MAVGIAKASEGAGGFLSFSAFSGPGSNRCRPDVAATAAAAAARKVSWGNAVGAGNLEAKGDWFGRLCHGTWGW